MSLWFCVTGHTGKQQIKIKKIEHTFEPNQDIPNIFPIKNLNSIPNEQKLEHNEAYDQ